MRLHFSAARLASQCIQSRLGLARNSRHARSRQPQYREARKQTRRGEHVNNHGADIEVQPAKHVASFCCAKTCYGIGKLFYDRRSSVSEHSLAHVVMQCSTNRPSVVIRFPRLSSKKPNSLGGPNGFSYKSLLHLWRGVRTKTRQAWLRESLPRVQRGR